MSTTEQVTPPDASRTSMPVRVLLVVGGSLALGLGVLGALLPILPTTPFVLLAAGCYARAWPPAHRWLRANRFFGPMCRSGKEGRYLPPRAKVFAVAFTIASFGASITFVFGRWPLCAILTVLGLIVTYWLLRLPTKPRPRQAPGDAEK